MDLAITNTGKIYFIEGNFRQNKFMTGSSQEYSEWGITCKVPIYYLNYLYESEINTSKS